MLLVLISVPKVVVTVVPVIRRLPGSNPGFVAILSPAIIHILIIRLLDKEEPEAGHQVQIDEEEEIVVKDLEHDLRALFDVALVDQLVDSENAVDFQDADQIKHHTRRLRVVE